MVYSSSLKRSPDSIEHLPMIMLTQRVLVAALTVVCTTLALPIADEQYPEVIPGPGLPSLASLNLTSKGLYTMTPKSSGLQTQAADFDLACFTGPAVCQTVNAQACVNYLSSLGTKNCAVSGDNTLMCQTANCQMFGSNIGGGASTSSYCEDCASGAQAIVNSCKSGIYSQGANAAGGNGNLIMNYESDL